MVSDWDDFELLLRYALIDEMRADPTENCLVTTENMQTGAEQREKLCELAFESLGVPMYLVKKGLELTCYAHGYTNATVLDVGHELIQCARIGVNTPDRVSAFEYIGGADMTNHLASSLHQSEGFDYRTATAFNFHTMKERLFTGKNQYNYYLPDGRSFQIDEKLKKECADVLFYPEKAMYLPGTKGIFDLLKEVYAKDLMFYSVPGPKYLCFNGSIWPTSSFFMEYFQQELNKNENSNTAYQIVRNPEIIWQSYSGAVIITSLGRTQQYFVTKAEYEEYGKTVVHGKCATGTVDMEYDID